MPKILILTSEFPPQPGGIGNHAYHLAKGLQENGYEVVVVCDQRSESGQEEIEFDTDLPFSVRRIAHYKPGFLRYFMRCRAAFSEVKYSEWVLCSGKFSLWTGGLLSLFYRREYVAVVHGSEIRLPNYFLRKLIQLSLKRFHKIIAVSHYTRSLISVDLRKIHVIPNGYSVAEPLPVYEQSQPVPMLVTVGKLSKRKGQHNVINALPHLLKTFPDLQYHLIGIPEERRELEKLALHLGVEKSIAIHGRLSEGEKVKILSEADIFVMLSEPVNGDVEGFGIAILEANAMGIPAIGAKGCGIEEAIKDGYSGKLIGKGSHIEFEQALTEILRDYQNYSHRAKTWAENFKWDKVIKRYLEVLGDRG